MRTIGAVILGCLLWSATAFGQGANCGTTWFCAGNETASADSVLVQAPQDTAAILVTIQGTFTATVQFESSGDGGGTWTSAQGLPQPSGSAVTSATAAGQWRFVASGFTNFRVRCSAYTSGTIVIAESLSKGSASMAGVSLPPSGAAGGDLTGTYPNPTLVSALKVRACSVSLGDGLNAISAGTYPVAFQCKNDFAATLTVTGITCASDNNGTTTCDVATNAPSDLLTGAITATTTFAAGTQSSTTTVTSGQWLKATFVADGTTKVVTIDIAGTL